MRTQQKRVTLHDGIVTEVLRGSNSTQVEIENGHYVQGEGYKKEPVTLKLDNPAQAEGLEPGMKVAIFKDAAGKTNLVRQGEYKASEEILVTGKNGKQYDNGVTVIMGRCVGARLVEPKEGQSFKPFFALSVVTADHTMHSITVNNHDDEYNKDNIEKTMRNFAYYMPNDKHSDFIPFVGTFLTGKAYATEEKQNGDFTNVTRKYSGLLNGKSFISWDYEKYVAPERSSSRDAEQGQEMPEPMPEDADGFANIPDGIDDELPFN